MPSEQDERGVAQSTDVFETERRIVQPTEYQDLLAEIESALRSLDDPFARVTVEGVSAEKHDANEALYELVSEAEECQNCGEPIEEGAWCGYSCLMEWGGAGDD